MDDNGRTQLSHFWLVLLFMCFLAPVCIAEIPHIMQYQGKATDKAGMPISGTHEITFRVYDAVEDGSKEWEETHTAVYIENGLFSLLLGGVSPLDLPFDEPYWLSIEIDSDGEMTPRQQLTSVPYAYRAQTVEGWSAIPSMFGLFGGDGSDGLNIIASDTNLSDLTGSATDSYLQATSFTVEAGATLTLDTGWAYIGVQDTCTIHGTIDAVGQGERAGLAEVLHDGTPGARADGSGGGTGYGYLGGTLQDNNLLELSGTSAITTQISVDSAVSGSGGGGGSGWSGGNGGAGGGAGAAGGRGGNALAGASTPGQDAGPTTAGKLRAITSGGSIHGHSSLFPLLVRYRGAGGGAGGYGGTSTGHGGNGGGVIYIECRKLVFDGVLNANGVDGTSTVGTDGAGGGGGGGVVLVRAREIVTNTGTVTASGGAGGTSTGGGGAGGNGADGFTDIVQAR